MNERVRCAAQVGADALPIFPLQRAGEVAEDVYVDVDDVYEDDPYGGDDASDWDDDSEDDWLPTGDRSADLPGDDDTPGFG